MKLSTRSRYGLKAVVDLAVAYGEGPVPLPVLAAAQSVSEAYLEQLLRLLRSSGVVKTVRGASGGYALCYAPETLSVGRVLKILEGGTALTDCVATDGRGCENACVCSARPLFLKLQSKIDSVLNDTSVFDLAKDYIEQKRRIEHEKGLS